MALSYHFSFTAPASVPAGKMESFLRKVERQAVKLGFSSTTVLNVPFDTAERREFARRLGGSICVTDERLKGVAMPSEEDVWGHDPVEGSCRLVPRHGVVLVLSDEQGCGTCFGFFKYPPAVRDINGKAIVDTGLSDRWVFKDFVDTPDRRFREIVKMFADAGYLESEQDEHNPQPSRP